MGSFCWPTMFCVFVVSVVFIPGIVQSKDINNRHRRDVFLTDSGFGSRTQASSAAARLALADTVFGSFGPGKRNGRQNLAIVPSETVYKFYGLHDSAEPLENMVAEKIDLVDLLGRNEIQKRPVSSDSGYGSRIHIGEQVAKDRAAFRDVFGRYGAGRR